MTKSIPCVVDTNVLHHANRQHFGSDLEARRKLARRLALLREIKEGHRPLLISRRVVQEYREHLRGPFNDYVQEFLSIAVSGATPISHNWVKLTGAERDRALKTCRFPAEDLFLLRTAYLKDRTTVIFSEERRVTKTDSCTHRYFSVHVRDPAV